MSQYKKKGFVLRFIFFVYLTTFKVSIFRSIITYNTGFQITFDKLANTRSTLPNNIQLTAYLYRIEDIYPDIAVSQRLAVRDYVPDISAVIADLEDKACTPNEPTVLRTHCLNASRRNSYSQGNRNIRNRGLDSYPNR